MKGIELSKAYYGTYGKKMIEEQFYEFKDEIAVGLVGEGSQCFGFDDQFSKDHDFGPEFCMWLPKEIYDKIGLNLNIAYNNLPQSFMGYDNSRKIAMDRSGVFEIESFYNKYTNCGSRPKDIIDWMKIPERFLATATNGEVFVDKRGEFSASRENLLSYYPDDVVKKKLASKIAIMAQSGQYNYMRCANRQDYHASYLACNEFIKNALSVIYILNRKYMPFYKWAFKATENLNLLRAAIDALKKLALLSDEPYNVNKKFEIIEYICLQIALELKRQFGCISTDSFLEPYAIELMQKINNPKIRALHIMADFD